MIACHLLEKERRLHQENTTEIRRDLKMINCTKQNVTDLDLSSYVHLNDLYEPLRLINNLTQQIYLQNSFLFQNETNRNVKDILKNINKIRNLIKKISMIINIKSRENEYCEIDLNKIVHTVKNDFALLLHDLQITLKIDLLPKIWAHPIQMHKLFSNLISYAIKSRSDYPLTIFISVTDSQNMWSFNVRYNGIKIRDSHQSTSSKVLENPRLYKNDSLEILMCKKIVKTHKGSIEYLPHAFGYSEFKIKIPK